MRNRSVLSKVLLISTIFAQCKLPGSTAEMAAKQDLPNFHEVHEFLYRGGEPTDRGLEELKQKNVETVIDLRATSERTAQEKRFAEKLGMRYINLPMDSSAPSKKAIDEFLAAVEEAQKSSAAEHPAVYVHCQHGSDRTGCLVGVWRVTHDGWDYPRAYEEMRKYYFSPKFTNLSGTVRRYAEKSPAAAN